MSPVYYKTSETVVNTEIDFPMSNTLKRIKMLVNKKVVRVSEHGFDRLTRDNISIHDVIESVINAQIVEDYSDFGKGSSVLVLQFDRNSKPIHVLWGIPKGHTKPAVIITAYRPDPEKWSYDFLRRNSEEK